MLLILGQDIADNFEDLSDEDIINLEDLLFYHSRFYHYIAVTKRTALDLIRKGEGKLTGRGVQTLRLMSTQSIDLPGLLKAVPLHAVVRQVEMIGCTVYNDDDKTKWVCDLKFAAKWFSQPSTLIGENLTDTKIFFAAGLDFAAENSVNGKMQKIKGEMSGGSGNAAPVMINRIVEGAGPVLCIIDSDKLSQNSDPSESVKKCVAVPKEMGGISYFKAVEERELENLLPAAIIEGAISELPMSPDRDLIQQRFELLKTLRAASPNIYAHVDVKQGTCMNWAANQNLKKFFEIAPVILPCPCHKNCDGLIAPPIFKEMLNKAADFVEKQSSTKLRAALVKEPRTNWLKFGGLVLSFALSNNVRAT